MGIDELPALPGKARLYEPLGEIEDGGRVHRGDFRGNPAADGAEARGVVLLQSAQFPKDARQQLSRLSIPGRDEHPVRSHFRPPDFAG
ncbi:hypothetical protein GCM10027405_01420 [Arthrobacter alkaliphilus]